MDSHSPSFISSTRDTASSLSRAQLTQTPLMFHKEGPHRLRCLNAWDEVAEKRGGVLDILWFCFGFAKTEARAVVFHFGMQDTATVRA